MILLDINDIFESISLLEKTLGIVFTLIITFVAALLKSKAFKDFISGVINNSFLKLFKKNKKKESTDETSIVKETDIINHDLFNYLDFWLYNQIPSIQLRTQYRNTVFRKYLHIYFKTYKDVILDFVRQTQYQKYGQSSIEANFVEINNRYHKNIRNRDENDWYS